MSKGALEWEVAESLPVSEVIKAKGKTYRTHIEAYKASLAALADGWHPHRLLQFHAGPGLDAHQSALAVAQWRHGHAI
jgi:mannonate dehydratase